MPARWVDRAAWHSKIVKLHVMRKIAKVLVCQHCMYTQYGTICAYMSSVMASSLSCARQLVLY